MKKPQKILSFLAGATLLATSSLSAATTDPVGYTSFNAAAGADLKVGVPLTQSAVLSAGVSSVSSGQVTFSATVPDVATDPHYLLVTTTDGALEGEWYTITSSTSSSVIVAEDLQAAGLTNTDTVEILPFWTLDTLFPNGGAVPASSDVFSPEAQVLLNDVEATGTNLSSGAAYLYHSGEQGPAGWYDVSSPNSGIQGNTVISPESFVTIRNQSASDANIVVSGAVPTTPIATNVLSRSAGQQDNLIANPYPADMTLAASNLVETGAVAPSSDVFAPVDQLLVFDTTTDGTTGTNTTPSRAYLYHSGEQGPAGWYDVSSPNSGSKDTDVIPGGAAIIIRKASGADEIVSWVPETPYTL